MDDDDAAWLRDFDDDDDARSTISTDTLLLALEGDRASLAPTAVCSQPGTISNRLDATLSRAFLSLVRGHVDGFDLPRFSLVHTTIQRTTAPMSTPRLRVIGETTQTTRVWHQIAAGFALLPGVRATTRKPEHCEFCLRALVAGTPLVHLKHVCTFGAHEQRVCVSVRLVCDTCAAARTPVLRDQPLVTVNCVFIRERITLELSRVLAVLGPELSSMVVQQHRDDDYSVCDACHRQRGTDALVVLARRRDDGELAVFVVCSDACRVTLQRWVRSMTDGSVAQPRPVYPCYELDSVPVGAGNTPHTATLPPPDDRPSPQWCVLSDDDFRSIATRGPDGIHGGVIVHWCTRPGCFCRDTHRGVRPNAGDAHRVLQRVYAELSSAHLYTDVLGSETQTLCIACRQPTTSMCVTCMAVRSCNSESCRRQSYQAHAALCRPHGEAWSAFVLL